MTRRIIAASMAALCMSAFTGTAAERSSAEALLAALAAPQCAPGGVKMTPIPMPQIYGGEADKPGAPKFKNLGSHQHKVTTADAEAQAYFDQGMNLLVGFNHAEAIRSFREAARLDPECAMCFWGVAFALGPNINLPMQEDAVAPAMEALGSALALKAKTSPEEQAWIDALAKRYVADPKADRAPLEAAFADAMGEVSKAYPDDLDAAQFYAEAMMDTQPWDYWEADAQTPKGRAAEVIEVLEGILARDPNHAGAIHLYIHIVEASNTPERAETASDRLEALMPDAGHIVHMPSHIYYRVGRYEDAAHVNEIAAKVDEDYIAQCKAQGFYPIAYYGHNIHLLWTSSEMDGGFEASIGAGRRLFKAVDALNAARMFAPGQLFAFVPVVTLLRFGKYDEVLAEPALPKDLALDHAVSLYARAFAFANLGKTAEAQGARDQLKMLIDEGAALKAIDDQFVPATLMAKVGLELVDGEMARKAGKLDDAIPHFREAANLERQIPYTEPPYWHQPVSHILGAALMEAGLPAEAELVYRESLKGYRLDGWALYGLTQALEAQGKSDEAGVAKAAYEKAWGLADVTLTSSRF